MKPRFIVRNEAGKRAVMRVSGVIDDYFNDQTYSMTDTEQELIRELKMIPEDRGIDLHVNSTGGQVALALGIHNALKSVQDRLRVINTGNMLSSATLLAPPKAKLLMSRGCVAMVHKPMLTPDQPMNANDMRNAIECLDANEKAMAEIYSDRTGKSMKAARDWMSGPNGAGTWMTGTEAIEHGFGDGDLDEDDDFGPSGDTRGDLSSAAVIAKFNGNIPEKYKQLILAAGAKRDPSPAQPVTAPAASLSTAKEAGNGGQPAKTNNQQTKEKTMHKIITALVAAGFKISAEANEDQIIVCVNDLVSARQTLTTENTDLKGKVESARRARIEAHVQSKVDAKIIKAELKEKWVSSILACESNQEMLDAMEAPTSQANAAPQRARGSAPPPADTAANGGQSDEEKLNELRRQMKAEKDPAKVSAMALEARKLRGHSDISFKQPEYRIINGVPVPVQN